MSLPPFPTAHTGSRPRPAPPPRPGHSGDLRPQDLAHMRRQLEIKKRMEQAGADPSALRDEFITPAPGYDLPQGPPPDAYGDPNAYAMDVSIPYPDHSQDIADLRADLDAVRDYLAQAAAPPPEATKVALRLERIGIFELDLHGLVVEAEYAVLVLKADDAQTRRFVPEPGATFELATLDGKFRAMMTPYGVDFEFGGLHFMPMRRLDVDAAVVDEPPGTPAAAAVAAVEAVAAELDSQGRPPRMEILQIE